MGGLMLALALVSGSLVFTLINEARIGMLWAVAVLSIAAMIWGSVRSLVPQRACQVSDARLRRGSLHQAAYVWGMRLGMGVCTFLVTPALYAFVAAAIAQGDPLVAGGLALLYGISRTMTIASFAIVVASRESTGRYQTEPALGLEAAMRYPLAVMVVLAAIAST